MEQKPTFTVFIHSILCNAMDCVYIAPAVTHGNCPMCTNESNDILRQLVIDLLCI